MKKLHHDGIGYVNNIGASKYWGVTTSKVEGRKIWIVNACEFSHRGDDFDFSEEDAARIAAFYYDSFARHIIPDKFVLNSFDGIHFLQVDSEEYKVKRSKITKLEAPQQQTIFELVKKDEPFKDSLVNKFWDKKYPDERELLATVTNMVLDKKISQTAARLLHNILEEVI